MNRGIGELAAEPRAIGAIMIHFNFFNTAADTDSTGVNPLDRVVISDGNGTIYRTIFGNHGFVESTGIYHASSSS